MFNQLLTPKEIVTELDKYIIGQNEAKKAVAIALRNRYRRQQVESPLQEEIIPNNIIMIGPTGVGKTEIARRLAKLAQAPFLKVEASKFTEVGYVGRDVESIVRDLMNIAVNDVKKVFSEKIKPQAENNVEEIILDGLLGKKKVKREKNNYLELISQQIGQVFHAGSDDEMVEKQEQPKSDEKPQNEEAEARLREVFRKKLEDGKLDDKEIEIEIAHSPGSSFEVFSNMGLETIDINLPELLGGKRKKKQKTTVARARKILLDEEINRLVDFEAVMEEAKYRVENHGIVFIDEIDKIAAGRSGKGGPDVSREGVQRDLLPIIEGSTVPTKYGFINTQHILFIAAGAFHVAKPSDLIPELQGRFPIRVELKSLTQEDFIRILLEPENALLKQYQALTASENCELHFLGDAIQSIAKYASEANEKLEDIGARRLHTILSMLLEEILFELPNQDFLRYEISEALVEEKIGSLIRDDDLGKYIL